MNTPLLRLISQLSASQEILEGAIEEYSPEAVIGLFSGGNDSTVMVHAMRPHLTHAAHIVTGIGIPSTMDHVRAFCASLKLPLLHLYTPPRVYWDMVLQHGFPGPASHRYCYVLLKERRLRELRKSFIPARSKKRIVFVTGIRASESARRMRKSMSEPVTRDGSIVWVNPLVAWDGKTVSEYRAAYALRQCEASALIHRSGECLCGAFARPGEMAELEMWFPETAKYIHALEAEAKERGQALHVWGMAEHQRKYAIPGQLCFGCVA